MAPRGTSRYIGKTAVLPMQREDPSRGQGKTCNQIKVAKDISLDGYRSTDSHYPSLVIGRGKDRILRENDTCNMKNEICTKEVVALKV